MHKIAVIKGDGIGPEVIDEGLKVLKAVSQQDGFKYELKEFPYNTDYYLATQKLPDDTFFEELKKFNAILVGAIGDPRVEPGLIERAIIAGIRFKLDLYINLRPIKLYAEHLCPIKDKKPADIDMIVVRENTEDLYTGIGGIFKKGTQDEVAIQEMIFTRKGTERAIRYAFELAKTQKRKKVTLVDKANAIRAMDIWTRTFEEVGKEFPDIEKDHNYVDAACMWMIKNPESFEVVVTNNIFGDIITDLGAMLQGGMGIAASGNIHPGRVSMFEPIHGSAPKYKGQNKANPLAAISACAMMLDYLGEKKSAVKIEKAIENLLVTKKIKSLGTDSGYSTTEIGDLVVQEIQKGK